MTARAARIPLLVVTGLLAAWTAGSLLMAQAVDTSPSTPPASQPAAPTTQPSAAPAPTEPTQAATRAGLLSGLVGSKHDFTKDGQTGRNLCLPCHVPHLLAVPPPLYDRRSTLTQPLRPFAGFDIELSNWSLLCLGCHDGVTAPDVFSSSHATSAGGQLANSRLGATRLRSHPVGVQYPLANDKYQPPAAVEAAGLMLPDGRIQCTTCHDAHNTNRHAGMLVISDERSRVCLTCHRL